MMVSDFFVGAALTAAGIGVVGLMTYPIVGPRGGERPAAIVKISEGAVADRWPRPREKADRLAPELTDVRPLGPTVALQLQPESGNNKPLPLPIIEQAIERKAVDEGAERATKEYHRAAARRGLDEPRDVCARHGMHRHYFHRRHHLSWRCVGRGR